MAAETPLHTVEGNLQACPPLDFAKSLAFLDAFTPMTGEQRIADGALTKAITLTGRAVAFSVGSTGDVEQPSLSYRFVSQRALSQDERRTLEDRVSFFLSLADDLRPFYALAEQDPAFAPVVQRLYGLHQPKFLTPFEIACWAVLTQRTPMAVARSRKMRLVERYGTQITVDGATYGAFPEPETLLEADPAELASAAGSERKAEYLRAVSAFFASADERELRQGDYDAVAAALRGVRGLGEWSTGFVLIRGLGRVERVPAPEGELVRATSRLYRGSQPLPPDELRALLDRYGPYQGYWAFYVRNAGTLGQHE